MKQETFTDIEYSCRKKKTKREEFLEIMDEIIPWDEWVGVIEPYYPKGKRGRPPMGIEKNAADVSASDLVQPVRSGYRGCNLRQLCHAEIHGH